MLNLADHSVVMAMKQSATVVESDGEGGEIVKIQAIDVIAYQGAGLSNTFGATVPLDDRTWTVIVVTPDSSIEDGDSFKLSSGEVLSARNGEHITIPNVADVQYFYCEEV